MFIGEDAMTAPPSDRFSYYNQFIRNIGRSEDDDKIKLILDLDKLLV